MILSYKRILFLFPVVLFLSLAAGQTEEQVYIIRKGDTLWDLAFRFLGDPFAWPRIWHQNPFIKDPNLIFPGDKLTISKTNEGQLASSAAAASGAASGATANISSTGSASAMPSDESFSSETKLAIEQSDALRQKALLKKGKNGQFSDSLFTLSMRRNGYFTSDFLEKIGFLWFNRDEKGLVSPGSAVIEKKESGGIFNRKGQETYKQFDNIVIIPFSKRSFHVGDTVSILHSDNLIRFGARTANLVRRTGRARITEVTGAAMAAELFKTWDVVLDGDRVDTMTHFPDLAIDTIVDPSVTIKGVIFRRVENTERPYLYHTCIIDRGFKDGVELGDIFAVISGRVYTAGHTEAIACAVNIGETSSTLTVEKLFDCDVDSGDTVVIIKRIHFKK